MRVKRFLPNPFVLANGRAITSQNHWEQWRKETKELVLELEYGTMPEAPEKTTIEINETEKEEETILFQKMSFRFFPKRIRDDVFFEVEVSIRYPTPSTCERLKNKIPDFGRAGLPCVIYVGSNSCSEMLESGYVIINYKNDQLEPMKMGNPIIGPARKAYEKLFPGRYSWGSISVWAWGALRMVDYAVSLPKVNRDQLLIAGHSINGKTALLAGALDERITLVNPAGSGCAGAGSYLVLDEGCEDIAALTDTRRWWAWMHSDFAHYGYNEERMLFDQHFLMGLVAPRPLLRTEGILDEWANPKGTAAAFLATEEIYKFLGVPDRNQLALRAGGHTQNHDDMLALLSVANEHFFGIKQDRIYKDLACEIKDLPPFMAWKCPKL